MKETINKKLYGSTTVELKEEKVELANVKDIDKKLKGLLDVQKQLDKITPAIEKLQVQEKDQKGLLNIRVNETDSFIAELEKQLKELGLDTNSVSGFNQLKNEVVNSKSYLK